MKPRDNLGRELDAEFSIAKTANGFELIIESRGGADGGPTKARNSEYGEGLELLLRRLSELNVVIARVRVESRVARQYSEADRTLSLRGFSFPLLLGSSRDPTQLRNALGRASAAFGRPPGAKGGNPTKRLSFDLQLASPTSEAELVQILVGSHIPVSSVGSSSAPLPVELEMPTADPTELESRVSVARARLRSAGGSRPPPPSGLSIPLLRKVILLRFERDPNVIAWVLNAAGGICEVCDSPAPFRRPDDEPYLEVHHVRPLAEGGPDTTDNAVAGCPNCHRELHSGAERNSLRERVIRKVERIKDYPMTVSGD